MEQEQSVFWKKKAGMHQFSAATSITVNSAPQDVSEALNDHPSRMNLAGEPPSAIRTRYYAVR